MRGRPSWGSTKAEGAGFSVQRCISHVDITGAEASMKGFFKAWRCLHRSFGWARRNFPTMVYAVGEDIGFGTLKSFTAKIRVRRVNHVSCANVYILSHCPS